MMRLALQAVGSRTRGALGLVGNLADLQLAIVRKAFELPRLNLRVLGRIAASQLRFSGLQAIPIIALLAAVIGAVGIMQFVELLTGLADDLIGQLIVTIIIREMGPLITAVILIGRSGTAMATELGSMRLGGEFEALQAYRIDPLAFVILPRVGGMIAAMFGLIVVFDVVGVLGGAGIVLALRGLSFSLVQGRVAAALTNADFGLSAVKALAFGLAVSSLSCYFGMRVGRSPTELPQAVTRAVVSSLLAVFLLDALLAAVWVLL